MKTRTKKYFNKRLFAVAVMFVALGTGVVLTGRNNQGKKNQKKMNNTRIIFPRPFAFAIDDLGWNIGNDDGYGDKQGPYRLGIDRKMDIKDYKCLVEVAKKVGVRLQGLFILGEMGRENILAKYPTTNPDGDKWDNSSNINEGQIEIMNYVKNNAAWLEFGLHGVLHEFWAVPGKRTRAEWYDIDNDRHRLTETMQGHIRCFKDIMAQYGLSEENGQSFPESFVPCAYAYYWNPEGETSTGLLMHNAGVKYANTLFSWISELNPPSEPNGGGIDHGVLIINRINYGNEWFALSSVPTVPIDEQKSDIIESHWTNWLAQDQFLQERTNKKWENYFQMVQKQKDRYLAKNTEQFYSQWLYKKYTSVSEEKPGIVQIDNTTMPDEVYQYNLLGNMVLKVKLTEGQHVSRASLNGKEMAAYYEDGGYGFIYLPELERKKYVLEYETGPDMPEKYVWLDGTFNVYGFSPGKKTTTAEIRLYGTQDMILIGLPDPLEIKVSNPGIKLLGRKYDASSKKLTLTLSARDIQGETGKIVLLYNKDR